MAALIGLVIGTGVAVEGRKGQGEWRGAEARSKMLPARDRRQHIAAFTVLIEIDDIARFDGNHRGAVLLLLVRQPEVVLAGFHA